MYLCAYEPLSHLCQKGDLEFLSSQRLCMFKVFIQRGLVSALGGASVSTDQEDRVLTSGNLQSGRDGHVSDL